MRITIADDHPIFRLGVRTLLACEPDLKVVAEAADSAATFETVIQLRPDVLLLGHSPPRLDGLDILRQLKSFRTLTRAIVVAGPMPESDIQTALLRGAWGVVPKSTASDILPGCIRQVMAGEHWIGIESVNALVGGLRAPSTGGSSSLTPREVDIVKLVARGANNKDVAARLGMGEQTVKNHLRRIFSKLQVTNRVELALLAVEHEVVLPARVAEDTL